MRLIPNDGITFLDAASGGTFVDNTFLKIASYASTPSVPVFTRGLNISGSLGVTGSITATSVTSSLFGTASFATTASFALNGGGGAAFPYTGSAIISGSLGVTGSVRGNIVTVTAVSQTASLDLNLGNAFVFNAVSSSASASLLTLTNIPTGSNQKFSLLISQSVAGGANAFFDSTFQFPSASQYTVSTTTGSVDILTFETYTY